MSIDRIKQLTDTLNKVENNLKEENKILNFILENITDGYWDWDIVTGYEYLSPKFKFQLGYLPHEMENSPEAWQKICHEDSLAAAGAKIQEIFEGKSDSFDQILKFNHKKSHVVNILCNGKLVQSGENGEPIRMVGTHTIIRDI